MHKLVHTMYADVSKGVEFDPAGVDWSLTFKTLSDFELAPALPIGAGTQ